MPVIGTLLQSAECGPHGLRNNICQECIGLKEFVTTEGAGQVVEVGCKREREQGLGKRKRKLNETSRVRFHLVGQAGAQHSQTQQLHSFSGKRELKDSTGYLFPGHP